ncbi:MAG: hypothetical protein M1821_007589 [Bathelium mastoideum]|nr:MAG: hypothetical protein M1821_007589 [Bathelium mastoideum]KAI9677947.1 MAG: hypothetical protein M1822_008055 [Bathelium mastoideum]
MPSSPVTSLLSVVIVFLSLVCAASSQAGTGSPLSVPATDDWDGIDGPWSSFWVQVGTPPQTLRLLPGTSANALWVVLPDGCTSQDPSNCNTTRDVFYNTSSTWKQIGIFHLGLGEESVLGYNANADNAACANETFTLGLPGSGLPTVNDSVVEGFATKDFYLGFIGLAPQAINLTTLTDPRPSILQSLKNSENIPSVSWGYTAGSVNFQTPTFGSLTLGGYDTSRFISNNLSFPFAGGSSSELTLSIQSITTDASDNSTLLSSGISAALDTMVSELWLPEDTCTAFEQAFGISWNDKEEYYLLNDSTHNALVNLNPNVTFELGVETSGGDTVRIVLPYSAFDLTLMPPYVSSNTRYFPLKRAQNSTQYTLGRTFFQNAYVITDYERSNFSISPALFPSAGVQQNLVPILPPGSSAQSSQPGQTGRVSQPGHSGLSGGAIAGIVIGVLAALAAIGAIIFFARKYKKPRPDKSEDEKSTFVIPRVELDASEPMAVQHAMASHDASPAPVQNEYYNKTGLSNELSNEHIGELDGGMTPPAELGSDQGSPSLGQAMELGGYEASLHHDASTHGDSYFSPLPSTRSADRGRGNPRVSELASTSEPSQISEHLRAGRLSPEGTMSAETRSDLASLQERAISPDLRRTSRTTAELESVRGRHASTDGVASEPDSEQDDRGRRFSPPRVSPPINLSPNIDSEYFSSMTSYERAPSPYIPGTPDPSADPFGSPHIRQDSGEVAVTPIRGAASPDLERESHVS